MIWWALSPRGNILVPRRGSRIKVVVVQEYGTEPKQIFVESPEPKRIESVPS